MNRYRYRCRCHGISWPDRATYREAHRDRARHIDREAHRASFRPALRMAAGIAVVGGAMAIWNWVHGR
ncbi:hypothetical protein [Streptomyces sp. NPDC059122]|uniref:hypothetical protein n=1 Tax=Streptomyces sp. NPDC059122 TaxID=3346732 RepID=UPI0036CC7DCB